MRNIVLYPLRLMVGWGLSPRILGILGVLMLVLLRLTIGWHFFSEGSSKMRSGNWDASPFFANAKGPFAEQFHEMVWDHDGQFRRDVKKTNSWLASFGNKAIKHYGFAKEQKLEVKQAHEDALMQLDLALADNANDLQEYDLSIKRIADMKADPARQGGGLKEQIDTVRRESLDKLKPTLTQVNLIWDNFEAAVNNIATSEQKSSKDYLFLTKPKMSMVDTNVLNAWVPYFDMIIGTCLLFGLFTPVAALAAAGFLGSVFLSSYPPGGGPTSTYYQLIEAMACLVLAATAAGRFGGLDYFLHMIVRKTFGQEESEDS